MVEKDCVIPNWLGADLRLAIHEKKTRVDYKPRLAHGHAVNNDKKTK